MGCVALFSLCAPILCTLDAAADAWRLQVIDAMFQPSKYDKVYPFSYIFTLIVTLPHSFLIQLAFPVQNAKYGVSAVLCAVAASVPRVVGLALPAANAVSFLLAHTFLSTQFDRVLMSWALLQPPAQSLCWPSHMPSAPAERVRRGASHWVEGCLHCAHGVCPSPAGSSVRSLSTSCCD